jgi:hypothetical protein
MNEEKWNEVFHQGVITGLILGILVCVSVLVVFNVSI